MSKQVSVAHPPHNETPVHTATDLSPAGRSLVEAPAPEVNMDAVVLLDAIEWLAPIVALIGCALAAARG
jgi:hypothetical protein